MSPRPAAPAVAVPRESRGPWERWGWLMSVIWLAFLTFPVLILSERASGTMLLGALALLAVFAAAYTAAFVVCMRTEAPTQFASRFALMMLAVMIAANLGVGLIDQDSAGGTIAYIAALAVYLLSPVLATAVVTGALVVATLFLTGILGEEIGQIPLLITLLVVITGVINRLLVQAGDRHELERQAALQTQQRLAVARDVHDLIGHSLTVVHLKAQLAERLVAVDPQRAAEEIRAIREMSAEAIGDVRSTVADLREGTGGDLAAQLRTSRKALESAGISVDVAGEPSALSPAQQIPARWVLREATTNILRHARASAVGIELAPGLLRIEDDGVGLQGADGTGSGLEGMRERAAAAGGALRVASPVEGGALVEVTW